MGWHGMGTRNWHKINKMKWPGILLPGMAVIAVPAAVPDILPQIDWLAGTYLPRYLPLRYANRTRDLFERETNSVLWGYDFLLLLLLLLLLPVPAILR